MTSDISKKDFLTFIIEDKIYAFPVLGLEGVLGNPQIMPVINAPAFVNGVIYLKEQIIPILDLRLVLSRPGIKQNKICVIVVRVVFKNTKKLVGFTVDAPSGIYNFENYKVEKLPLNESEEFIEGIVNMGNKMVLLLDLTKLVNSIEVINFLNLIWNLNKQDKNVRHL